MSPDGISVTPFPPEYRASGCCCTSLHCPRLTASAMWDLPHYLGSIVSPKLGRVGGRCCRSVPPVTAIRHINRFFFCGE